LDNGSMQATAIIMYWWIYS